MIELNVLSGNTIGLDVNDSSQIPLDVMTGGSGGITPIGTKQISITENGTTTENVYNYANAEIDVNVPTVTPTGTKSISITQNGTTTEDVTNYANAQITANVPNTYTVADEGKVVDDGALVSQTSKSITANGTHDTTTNNSVTVAVANSYTSADEGKVVDNGALVSQSSATYTANDTYDTTLINEVTVNVSGGGGTELYDFIDNTLTELIDDDGNATTVTEYGCYKKTALTKIRLQGCASLGTYAFNGCSNVATIVLPSFSGNLTNREFQGCSSLKAIDLGGGNKINFSGQNNPPWLNDAQFDTLIIRKTDSIMALSPLAGTAYTFNGTPFASSGSGGTLYVPSALVNTYKTATNWATWFADDGSHNNQVLSIESTHTDPNAPIDLTLYYADGTPIPT